MAQRLSQLEPLLVGRSVRVLLGIAVLAGIPFVPSFDLAWLGILALLLAGASLILGGLLANPGCEVTALPNLVLPKRHRVHFT